jgi:hypothetical protein
MTSGSRIGDVSDAVRLTVVRLAVARLVALRVVTERGLPRCVRLMHLHRAGCARPSARKCRHRQAAEEEHNAESDGSKESTHVTVSIHTRDQPDVRPAAR